MKGILSEFNKICQNPYEQIAKWKSKTGRMVVGCFPLYIPEEIIHAAGCLPITLLGSREIITLADIHLAPIHCCIARSNLDMALKGKMDFLDGVIFSDICDITRQMPDIWKSNLATPFQHRFGLAGKVTSARARQYIAEEIERLGNSLGRFTGNEISSQAIRQSIDIYNENRSLLNRLYQLRKNSDLPFRTRDVAMIVQSSMLIPKEEHTQLLTKLLQFLEHDQSTKKPPVEKVLLVLSGGLCHSPQEEILDIVEELGAAVVDDDLYIGRRYFTTQVNNTQNPIDALADRYIRDIPCCTKYSGANNWAKYLIGLVKESGAKGIVELVVKFCEPHNFDLPQLNYSLSQASIPHIIIETERTVPIGQIKTKLQAFIETL